jgi:hypothetical protein
MSAAFGDHFGTGLYVRPDPKVKRCRSLWIEIAKQGWGTGLRCQIGEVHGGGGFTHTAFGMKNGQGRQVTILNIEMFAWGDSATETKS